MRPSGANATLEGELNPEKTVESVKLGGSARAAAGDQAPIRHAIEIRVNLQLRFITYCFVERN